jgi:CheR methyltransferase, SAM binding domain/Histidine kinase-, DNA gyrase B-, and HSP90-like ATPase
MNASVSLRRPSLFQDVKTVTYLKQEVLPVLLARAQEQPRELRLWLVGCGSGEDPYTLAMLLTDLLGSYPLARTINVFATDEDETGLARARRGLYTAHQVAGVPRAYRERFFVRLGKQYQVISGDRLSYETGADTLLCLGDAGRIEQVCVNLMSNALKYSPSSSPVVVRVMREPESIPVPQALISVQDQGPGIRPEAQNEIFRRFYREPGEGLGLGLYVAHEIVMLHGGRVWVESTVGSGSTFYVALPLLEEIVESEPIVI